jgi:hypothetical protein
LHVIYIEIKNIFKGMIELSQLYTNGLVGSKTNDFFFKLLDTELFVTRTVGELIYGYNDPLMDLANTFLPSLIKENKFSLMNGVYKLGILNNEKFEINL